MGGFIMNEIVLKLSVDEVNQVLFALSDKPYKDVFQLIGKIQEQANTQISKDKK